MNLSTAARDRQNVIDNAAILKSFCLTKLRPSLIYDLKSLLLDDAHLSASAIASHQWQSIYSDNNWGAIDVELAELIHWWTASGISTVYATSRDRIINHDDKEILVMKLETPSTGVMNGLQLGSWMFGPIPDLASQRIADWRADVWFSDPLQFIVLSEHDVYGSTSIAGPSPLIEAIKRHVHEDYDWKDGVVPDSFRGAAFPAQLRPSIG